MEIRGADGVSGSGQVGPRRTTRAAAPNSTSSSRGPDQAEISEIGKLKSLLASVPESRSELVAQLKAQIEDGSYETPERLRFAVSRLLEDL